MRILIVDDHLMIRAGLKDFLLKQYEDAEVSDASNVLDAGAADPPSAADAVADATDAALAAADAKEIVLSLAAAGHVEMAASPTSMGTPCVPRAHGAQPPYCNAAAHRRTACAACGSRPIARPGSAVFIISDFIGLGDNGIKQLRLLQRHCDVRAILVYDPMERSLPARGGRYLTNGETLVPVDLDDRALRESFTRQFDQRVAKLQQQLAQQAVPLLTLSTIDDALQRLREHSAEPLAETPLQGGDSSAQVLT